jgi:hypothetical protein
MLDPDFVLVTAFLRFPDKFLPARSTGRSIRRSFSGLRSAPDSLSAVDFAARNQPPLLRRRTAQSEKRLLEIIRHQNTSSPA